MKTPCAFHPTHYIIKFCKCLSCLLPLCQQCIIIHQKQHSNLKQSIQLVNIDYIVNQVSYHIQNQFQFIDTIAIQTTNKYRESQNQHNKLYQQILHHKQTLINAINLIYENILHELQNNAKRRNTWINQFNLSLNHLKQQFISLSHAISGDKYLRTVIMWNRMKPNQIISQVTKKSLKQWLIPSFTGCHYQPFVNFVTNNTNLKVLQIQGDSGIQKILSMIRVLRYGEQQATVRNSFTSTSTTKNNNNNHPQIINFYNNPTHNAPIIQHHRSHNNIPIENQKNIYYNSPSKKSSTKKLQVLSNLQQFKLNLENQ